MKTVVKDGFPHETSGHSNRLSPPIACHLSAGGPLRPVRHSIRGNLQVIGAQLEYVGLAQASQESGSVLFPCLLTVKGSRKSLTFY